MTINSHDSFCRQLKTYLFSLSGWPMWHCIRYVAYIVCTVLFVRRCWAPVEWRHSKLFWWWWWCLAVMNCVRVQTGPMFVEWQSQRGVGRLYGELAESQAVSSPRTCLHVGHRGGTGHHGGTHQPGRPAQGIPQLHGGDFSRMDQTLGRKWRLLLP